MSTYELDNQVNSLREIQSTIERLTAEAEAIKDSTILFTKQPIKNTLPRTVEDGTP